MASREAHRFGNGNADKNKNPSIPRSASVGHGAERGAVAIGDRNTNRNKNVNRTASDPLPSSSNKPDSGCGFVITLESPTTPDKQRCRLEIPARHSAEDTNSPPSTQLYTTKSEQEEEEETDNHLGTHSEQSLKAYLAQLEHVWNDIQDVQQPTWLQKLQKRLANDASTKPHREEPCAGPLSSLPLPAFDTPTALFSPHWHLQPSAQVWAWCLFHGCDALSRQATKAGNATKLCRMPDPDISWEYYIDTQGNPFWELSHVFTIEEEAAEEEASEDESISMELPVGGIVYHMEAPVSTKEKEEILLPGVLLCGLAIIGDQICSRSTALQLDTKSQYRAQIISITSSVVRVFAIQYDIKDSRVTCDLLKSCLLTLSRSTSESLLRLEKEWHELIELVLDTKG